MLHVRSEDVDTTLTSRGKLDDLFNHFILVSFDLRFQSVDGKHLSSKWAREIKPATNLQHIRPNQKEYLQKLSTNVPTEYHPWAFANQTKVPSCSSYCHVLRVWILWPKKNQACRTPTHPHTHTPTHPHTHTPTHPHTHTPTHPNTHTHTVDPPAHTHKHTPAHTQIHRHTNTHTHKHTYTHTHTHTHTHRHIHTYTHTHIHTYTHTHASTHPHILNLPLALRWHRSIKSERNGCYCGMLPRRSVAHIAAGHWTAPAMSQSWLDSMTFVCKTVLIRPTKSAGE